MRIRWKLVIASVFSVHRERNLSKLVHCKRVESACDG